MHSTTLAKDTRKHFLEQLKCKGHCVHGQTIFFYLLVVKEEKEEVWNYYYKWCKYRDNHMTFMRGARSLLHRNDNINANISIQNFEALGREKYSTGLFECFGVLVSWTMRGYQSHRKSLACIRLSSWTSLPSLSHLTGRSFLETWHSKMAVSFSGSSWSLRGIVKNGWISGGIIVEKIKIRIKNAFI